MTLERAKDSIATADSAEKLCELFKSQRVNFKQLTFFQLIK